MLTPEQLNALKELLNAHNALDIFCKAFIDGRCYSNLKTTSTLEELIMDGLLWSNTNTRYEASIPWSAMCTKWKSSTYTYRPINVDLSLHERKKLVEALQISKSKKARLLIRKAYAVSGCTK